MSETMKMGAFCWNELMTRDVEAAKSFYSAMFGWQLEAHDMGGFTYTTFKLPGAGATEHLGGMMAMDGPQFEGVPPHWMGYIAVADLDASVAKCKELGGEVKLPPTEIPNTGRFSVIADPTGAIVSLFEGPA